MLRTPVLPVCTQVTPVNNHSIFATVSPVTVITNFSRKYIIVEIVPSAIVVASPCWISWSRLWNELKKLCHLYIVLVRNSSFLNCVHNYIHWTKVISHTLYMICREFSKRFSMDKFIPYFDFDSIIKIHNFAFVHSKSSCQYQFTSKKMALGASWRFKINICLLYSTT